MAVHVSENNTRTSFTISKELKKRAEEQAVREKRSFSNLITIALEEYLNKKAPTD